MVYSWGDGYFGKLGLGRSESCNVPKEIDRLRGLCVCQIECGAQFSLARTKSGQVWTWGKGDYFRLGHGTDAHVRKPTLVEGLVGKKIIHVAVSALHCLAVTEAGKVYAGETMIKENSTTTVNRKPALVHGLEGYKINKVACGSSHSVAWAITDLSTPMTHEPVLFSTSRDPLGATILGQEWTDWSSEIRIQGDEIHWKFTSNGSFSSGTNRHVIRPHSPLIAFHRSRDMPAGIQT